MTSALEIRSLILDFHRDAEAHRTTGRDSDILIGFMLHSQNLERLVTLEYVRMGRVGLIVPFLARPSLKEKCDAVLDALQRLGFASDAISAERFSVLMPKAGVAKHALYPSIDGLNEYVGWARDATADLYRHYFDEGLPTIYDSAA